MVNLISFARTVSLGSVVLMASLLQVSQDASALTSQTISFAALPNKVMNDVSTTVSATASSGLTVIFTTPTPAVCTVSGTTVNLVSAGNCWIYANQPGDATYSAAPQAAQLFTVGKTAQTISFAALPNKLMSDLSITVSATASSGLAVVFTAGNTAYCTVSGTTVTFVTAGPCMVLVNQAGNAYYSAAPQGAQSFTISKTAQTISFAALPNKLVSDASIVVSATASSGLAVVFTSPVPAICTVSGTTVTLVSNGTCWVYANQAGNAYYSAAPQAAQSFTVSKTAQTINFPALPNKLVSDASTMVSATASSGLAVVFTSPTPAICTVSGTTVTLVSNGTCWVYANQAGNAIYSAAPQAAQSFTVSKTAQTISFLALPAKLMSDGPIAVSATASSSLTVAFSSGNTAICTVSGTTVTLVSVGTCWVYANQAGNAYYSAAPQVAQSFTVSKGNQTIGFAALPAKLISDGSTIISATASSGLAVSFTSTTTATCTVSGTNVTLIAIGTCTLAANQAGNANYHAAAAVMQSFVIAKGTQTITFAVLADKNLGDAPFPVSATATSGLPVTFASATPGVCTVSGATVTLVSLGTCTITADQVGNAGFEAAGQVTRSFNVVTVTAQVFYVHADHLGTPRAITRPSDNAVVWRWDNTEPFGANLPNENPSGLGMFTYNHRFPGQYYDAETGTHYNRFRDYDPSLGRYVQSDPIGLTGGMSTFGYANGNPAKFIDPAGLAYFALRPLSFLEGAGVMIGYSPMEVWRVLHEQLFFEDGLQPKNIGWGPDGYVTNEDESRYLTRLPPDFNDCIMRKAVSQTQKPSFYSLTCQNCQMWALSVRAKYSQLASDPKVLEECGCKNEEKSWSIKLRPAPEKKPDNPLDLPLMPTRKPIVVIF